MINTSRAYAEAIREDRIFCIADKITFADGGSVVLSLDDVMAYSINDATTESGKFQVGAAIIKEYSVTLNNFEGKFNRYAFEGADITADIGLVLADGRVETLRKGIFRVVKAVGVETISIKAYDSMLFFDRPYSESTLVYPATIRQVVQDACACCQMSYNAATIANGGYVVRERPSDDALTFRDVISYAAQIMGCYARISRMDVLEFGWYPSEDDANLWGGIFDGGSPSYETGDHADGGSFRPWSTGDVHNADFSSMQGYHHLYDLKTKNINTDDIVITGVQVYPDSDEGGEIQSAMYGEDGYVVVIEQNPLIRNASDAQSVAAYVGNKLRYSCFRPMTITVQSDPRIEAGDAAIVSYSDKKSDVHTVITNTTFSLGGGQTVICSAEAPADKTYTKYSAQTRIAARAKRAARVEMDAYDIAVQQMNQLAANTFGFYATTVKNADGSMVAYQHDKPLLEESKTVYKRGIDGFWVTQDYRGSDSATSSAGKWKAGFNSNGDAVLNLLYAIGIQAQWVNTRGLVAVDNNGSITFQVRENDGAVLINATSFTLSGKPAATQEYASGQAGNALSSAKEYASGQASQALSSAKNYANSAAAQAVNAQSQESIFNKLTNGGQMQGVFLKDGKLYLNFSYALGGTLKLGGSGNGNGLLSILDASGLQVGYIDNTGVHFDKGTFAGALSAATGTFEGELAAASGTFSGTLSGGDIIGSKIAGGEFSTIKTSTSDGDYGINMKDRILKFYSDSKLRMYNLSQAQDVGSSVKMDMLLEIGTIFDRSDYFDKGNTDDIWTPRHCGYIKTNRKGLLIDKLEVTGAKSRVAGTEHYGSRCLYCYETPSPMFADMGTGRLDPSGECYVEIDDVFSETVDLSQEYLVFLQKEGNGDLWVTAKEAEYFLVKGTPGLDFAWEIKAAQKGFEYTRLEEIGEEYGEYDDSELDELYLAVLNSAESEDQLLSDLYVEEITESERYAEQCTDGVYLDDSVAYENEMEDIYYYE